MDIHHHVYTISCGWCFWAAAEPLFHFLDTPPHFNGVESGIEGAVSTALAPSFTDWEFLAWAILGTLGTTVLMYAHYEKKFPLTGQTVEKNKPDEKEVID